MKKISAGRSIGSRTAGSRLLAGFAFAMMASASTSAFAQCVTTSATGGGTVSLPPALTVPGATSAAALSAAIGNVNTAFLTQQGSAFVSAPANPSPNQPGGGVWARGVGGEVTLKSNSSVSSTATAGGAQIATTTSSCDNSQRQTFAGVQVGADIARLNWNGFNVHLGTTAGYLGAKSSDNNQFSNTYDIPFIGTYLVATKGRFFADLMVKQEFYNVNLGNSAGLFFDRPVGAHGYSISTSLGYNHDLGNNWFIEPSAGFIYSRTSVDDFSQTNNALVGFDGISAKIRTNDITSQVGRLSLRVGTAVATPTVVWQPFASASVFHEFAGDVTSNYTTYSNNVFYGGLPGQISSNFSTSRVGTYGQYSAGIAGQIVNTGWLGFARVDYRNGSNIEGWTGNAGIRYQFTPEVIAAPLYGKVKAPAAPFIAPTNWTGFYIGGFFGAAYGRTDMGYAGTTEGSNPWVFGPLGGGQIGYNNQFANNFVLGVEGDIGAAAIKGGRIGSGSLAGSAIGVNAFGVPGAFSPAYFTLNDKTNWMATATARVGYAYGRTLYYVRGGGAWEDSVTSATCSLGPTAQDASGFRQCRNQLGVLTAGGSSGNRTRTGWLIGFGTEFDLGKNWSAKTEYNYIDFGSRSSLLSDGTTILTDKAYISQVKVGVNYKFSPAAVIAKY
jgi:opacity protein-like surface antigen